MCTQKIYNSMNQQAKEKFDLGLKLTLVVDWNIFISSAAVDYKVSTGMTKSHLKAVWHMVLAPFLF